MLIYSNIQTQQNANNAQRTMKKERSSIQSCPLFFFSLPFVGHHAFVEDKLSAYQAIYQCVMYHIQHFNTSTLLHPSTSPWETAGCPKLLRSRHAIMPTSRHSNMTVRKHGDISTGRHGVSPQAGERRKASGDHRQRSGFSKRKSHSSLGRFLHAPLR